MSLSKVKIHMHGAGRGIVEVDGVPMNSVRKVLMEGAVGQVTAVTLELVAEDVEVTADGVHVEERRVREVNEREEIDITDIASIARTYKLKAEAAAANVPWWRNLFWIRW